MKKLYLYLVSFVTLVWVLFGAVILLDQALRAWVIPGGNQPTYHYPCLAPDAAKARGIVCNQATIDLQRKIDQEDYAASQQRDTAQAIAMIAIGVPACWWHWRQVKKPA